MKYAIVLSLAFLATAAPVPQDDVVSNLLTSHSKKGQLTYFHF